MLCGFDGVFESTPPSIPICSVADSEQFPADQKRCGTTSNSECVYLFIHLLKSRRSLILYELEVKRQIRISGQ